MMPQQTEKLIECSYCREFAPESESECPWCGAPLPSSLPSQAPAGDETAESKQISLKELVERSNQDLVKAGTRAAELAFGIGCTLGVIIAFILLASIAVITTIFFSINNDWTILAVVALILALISFLVSSYLSTRARQATTRTVYERDIKPEIDQYLTANKISLREFIQEAAEILPEDSSLLVSLKVQDI